MIVKNCENCWKTNCPFCDPKTLRGFQPKEEVIRKDERERIIKIIEEVYDEWKSNNCSSYTPKGLKTLVNIIIKIKECERG